MVGKMAVGTARKTEGGKSSRECWEELRATFAAGQIQESPPKKCDQSEVVDQHHIDTHICTWALTNARTSTFMHDPTRCIPSAANSSGLFHSFFRLVLRQPLLQLGRTLKLGLLDPTSASSAGSNISSSCTAFSFSLGERLQDALIVCLDNVFWNTLHAKYLHV